MNQDHLYPEARGLSDCLDATRVLVLRHIQGDTYSLHEGGEVSLLSRETLMILLQQLTGR